MVFLWNNADIRPPEIRMLRQGPEDITETGQRDLKGA